MYKKYNWVNEINDDELIQLTDIIKSEGVFIFPTETVYGIGGNALSKNVIEKIYEIKRRPHTKPLSILVKDKREIEKYAIIQDDLERKIINDYMPGPITLILKRRENIFPNILTNNNDTIGIRIPKNKIINKILNELDFPIAAPSANITGEKSPTSFEDIEYELKKDADIIIDGGECQTKLSSTIVRVINKEPIILRKGSIFLENL